MHLIEERLRTVLPARVGAMAFGLLDRVYPKADWAPRFLRARTTFEAITRNSVDAYVLSVSVLRDQQRHALYSPAFRTQLSGYSARNVFRHHAARAAGIRYPIAPMPA